MRVILVLIAISAVVFARPTGLFAQGVTESCLADELEVYLSSESRAETLRLIELVTAEAVFSNRHMTELSSQIVAVTDEIAGSCHEVQRVLLVDALYLNNILSYQFLMHGLTSTPIDLLTYADLTEDITTSFTMLPWLMPEVPPNPTD